MLLPIAATWPNWLSLVYLALDDEDVLFSIFLLFLFRLFDFLLCEFFEDFPYIHSSFSFSNVFSSISSCFLDRPWSSPTTKVYRISLFDFVSLPLPVTFSSLTKRKKKGKNWSSTHEHDQAEKELARNSYSSITTEWDMTDLYNDVNYVTNKPEKPTKSLSYFITQSDSFLHVTTI